MSQTLAPVRETAFSPVSLRRVFVANARSEWTKLRTVRSTIWALVLTVIFTVGLGALFTGIEVSRWDHRTLTEIKGFDPLLYSFAGLNLAQLSIGALGVLVMTSEYSTRTIKLTFAAAPQRTLLPGAKVATFSAVVAVVGLISCFAAFWVCQALLAPEHAGLSISGPGVLFAVLLVVPGLVTLLPSPWNNDITRYLPSSAGAAMSAVARFPSLLSPGGGLIVLCAYAAAALLLAALADLITAPDLTATRAITIHAPADRSWPWIAQLRPGPRRLLQLRLAREPARPRHPQRGSRGQRMAAHPGRGPDQAGRRRRADRHHR